VATQFATHHVLPTRRMEGNFPDIVAAVRRPPSRILRRYATQRLRKLGPSQALLE
jgi:hypothetical protein